LKKVAKLSSRERQELFDATGMKMGIRADVVEKDFWVCFMLNHLFQESQFKDYFVFKGGTSLSKSYHVIKRFSEDIDIVLDWRKVITDNSNPWDIRSKTKQDIYNKNLNKLSSIFFRDTLAPKLNEEISIILGRGQWFQIDFLDEMSINFLYPRIYEVEYITPYIRLEIGPLAEWSPSHISVITPFVAQEYEFLFQQKNISILTIDVEKTFWEKIMILHKIACFPETKILPHRYARHLYDVYCMGNSYVKEKAFKRKELLEKDVLFEKKFYYSKSANYDEATLKTIKLIPSNEIVKQLRNDYIAMENMFYGDKPIFEEMMSYLKALENEIHNLQ